MPIGRHLTRGPEGTLHAGGPLLAMCWLAGWYFKDQYSGLMWFYFIPPVVVFLSGLAWLALAHGRIWWPQRLFVFAVTMIALGQVFVADCRWEVRSKPQGDAIRLVQWNTARRYKKAPDIFRALARDKADICVLSESPRVPDLYELGRKQLGLEYALDDQGMTIFSRFPLRPMGTVRIDSGRASVVRLATPRGDLDVMAIDLISHPLINRFKPMSQITSWVAAHDTGTPLIVAGDFNTMRDSMSFDSLRTHMREAYEIGGSGWPYSWPLPVPVYSIDHVWVSAKIEVLRQRYETSWLSDHRRQVVEFRF